MESCQKLFVTACWHVAGGRQRECGRDAGRGASGGGGGGLRLGWDPAVARPGPLPTTRGARPEPTLASI